MGAMGPGAHEWEEEREDGMLDVLSRDRKHAVGPWSVLLMDQMRAGDAVDVSTGLRPAVSARHVRGR